MVWKLTYLYGPVVVVVVRMDGRTQRARDMANELGFLFRLPPWLADMFDTGVGETRGLESYVVGERGVIELD